MGGPFTAEQIRDAAEAGRRLVRALPPATSEAERRRRRRFLRQLDREARAMLAAVDLPAPDGPDLEALADEEPQGPTPSPATPASG